jgi:hypothetical protein
MVQWLLRIGLGRLVALLQRRGYLTDAEATKAAEAVQTLAEIGMAEAAKPHGKSKEEIGLEAVIADRREHDPDNMADALNRQQLLGLRKQQFGGGR